MLFTIIGIASAVLFLIGDSAYALDTIKGTTRPHRITFGIFVLMNVIDVLNQLAIGATNSVMIFAAALITTAIIFGLSFWRGVGGSEPLDWVVLAGALAGLLLWGILRTPMASIVCNLVVTTIAMVPIVKKSYLTPASEPSVSWLLCGLSSVLSAISVGSWNVALLILPIHGVIIQLGIWAILVARRHHVPGEASAEVADIPALV